MVAYAHAVGLRAEVDREACLSAGRCVAAGDGHFVFDDDELATVDPATPPLTDHVLVEIARNCPAGAITLVDG